MFKKIKKTSQDEVDFKAFNILWPMAVISIFLLPIIINSLMMSVNIPTASGLTDSDWLGFWGGYLSGAAGLLFTMLMFMITYLQNEQLHKLTRMEMKEQSRLQVLPVIDVSEDRYHSCDGDVEIPTIDISEENLIMIEARQSYAQTLCNNGVNIYLLKIRNMGAGPILDCHIVHNKAKVAFRNLSPLETIHVYLQTTNQKEKDKSSELTNELDWMSKALVFEYQDAMQNHYKQEFQVKYRGMLYEIKLTSAPKLI